MAHHSCVDSRKHVLCDTILVLIVMLQQFGIIEVRQPSLKISLYRTNSTIIISYNTDT